VTKINGLGWQAKTDLSDGVTTTYKWFQEALDGGRLRL